ncbi:MAG TPA: lamin tail domain-containing protein, partial [Lapillicoccus sp.]|uniref:lamin tail domain-containing protein n=1 Tax=Lapillicoccus sp. TaxID=1909287 RepID=UPI002F920BD6
MASPRRAISAFTPEIRSVPVPLSSLSSPARRLAALALLPLAGTALVAAAPTAQAVDIASPVVISEVYGGGGNSGAPFTNDFIELYNNGSTAVDLSTWSVQYAAAGGSSWTNKTNLSGSVAAKSYFLIQEAPGATAAAPLPDPNVNGSIAMSGTAGKVALVNNQTTLTCGTDCDGVTGVVDFVGYGAANDYAGAGPAPALSNTTSAQRNAAVSNTGNNAADFTVAGPTPKTASGPVTPPVVDCAATPADSACQPGPKTIQDIQGTGFLSPERGNTVERVAGIVTAVRFTGGNRGFWIQQPTPDLSRPSASSGIFVFTGTPATVGDSVLVTGRVSDFYPLASGETLATTASLSITEITPTLVTVVSTSNIVPPPLDITPTTVPDVYAPPLPAGVTNVETITTVDPTRSALEFWEAHEGMLVTVNDARVVGPGQQQFREIYVTTKPHELETPRGGTYIKSYADIPTGRLLIIPTSLQVPAANVGDVLSGDTTGPVDWSTFGGYMIAATTLGTYVDNHLPRTEAVPQATNQLAVATYNVENLAPANPQEKFDRLAAGIVGNLKSPDVIAVEEIQDNSGATDDGVVAADQTLAKLVTAISKGGGPTYAFAQINPVDDLDGGQPGGNIRSVFLYNPDRVTLVAKPPAAGVDPSTTGVTVTSASDGTAALSLSPGRVDPTNTLAWGSSRKPLAAEFVFQDRKVIVVANHFNSKGGDQSADGRFQPPNRSSETQRTEQAKALNTFVKSVLTADPNANVVLAGDFNDYQFSTPIQTLTDNGATLTDLITTLPENERYTYVFNGVSQVLDHIFVTKPITDVQYQVIHNNAEFADQASDHDPQVVRIRPTVRQGTLTLDPPAVFVGQSTTIRLAGWYPNRTFTITLDGASIGSVTTDPAGA